MSAILFSHPRSGSSHVCHAIQSFLYKRYDSNCFYLSEFLNHGCTDTFGNLIDYLQGKTENLTALILKQNINYVEILEPMNKHIGSTDLFQSVTVSFNSREEFDRWYANELDRRIKFLEFLVTTKFHFVMKHFFVGNDNFLLETNNRLAAFAKENNIGWTYYRKDFYQSTMSSQIKYYYIDIPDSTTETVIRRNSGHNPDNKMEPMQPVTGKKIVENFLQARVSNHLQLFKFQKEHQFKTLAYEDLLKGQQIKLSDSDIIDFNSELKTGNYPMKYTVDKELFFENSNIVRPTIYNLVAKMGLEEVIKELDIQI